MRTSMLGGAWAVALAACVWAGASRAACSIDVVASLPVTMEGMQPQVPAKINGTDVRLVLDSGAFFSMITPGNAAALHLRLQPPPFEMRVSGIGGDTDISVAVVRDFGLVGADLHNIDFMVGGSEVGETTAGLLGQNVLALGDIDYDLAHGAVRLVKPKGCGDANLAYWAGRDGLNVVRIATPDPMHPHTIATVLVNGVRVRAVFDTGAGASMLGLPAARRAGIRTDGPDVRLEGESGGIGGHLIRTWNAPVASVQIGDETVKNTRLEVGELDPDIEMLIGADFFLSHHVYVANGQQRMYFTYSGGPVFKLPEATADTTAPVASTAAPSVAAETHPIPGAPSEEPSDADGFSRRGAALAARRDYVRAIADLTRAIQLAPDEPRYRVQRAEARVSADQTSLAIEDLDAALTLKPDDPQARLARASLRLRGDDGDGARQDLDAAAAALPKPADLRLRLGELYLAADAFSPAIADLDLWIDLHPEDSRQGLARNARCWARALAGRELDRALSDCNAALRQTTQTAQVLDSRGLVHLRRGELQRAVEDYDAALKIDAKIAWSLYGRGLAEMKMGQAAKGNADLAAAAEIDPRQVARAKALGLTPEAFSTDAGSQSAQRGPAAPAP